MAARDVLAAISQVEAIYKHHPALVARMARAGASCLALAYAYEAYLADRSTGWWFTGDSLQPRERSRRRTVGKRQRQARQVQQVQERRR